MFKHKRQKSIKLADTIPAAVCEQCIVNPGNPDFDNAAPYTWSSKARGCHGSIKIKNLSGAKPTGSDPWHKLSHK